MPVLVIFLILFLFHSYNMLSQCTNTGLFPFYQYTCKLLSSKVTSEVLFNCLFIFPSSCMVIPSACHCSLHFHMVCWCCFTSKPGCKSGGVWDIPVYLSSTIIWFSKPWTLVTISGMWQVVIKGMGAVALDWNIPEVWNESFSLVPGTV